MKLLRFLDLARGWNSCGWHHLDDGYSAKFNIRDAGFKMTDCGFLTRFRLIWFGDAKLDLVVDEA